MSFTNIHVAPAPPSAILDSLPSLPRLRRVTNDPEREYAQRAGEVDRLPDSIAAMILCKKGFSKVQRNGIRVEGVLAKPLNFWSENSVTIEEKAGTNEKVLWVLNRLQPDVLHILKPSGEYVESIPLEGRVPWFDEEATRKIRGAKLRSQGRSFERVRLLHAPDSEAAADAASANDAAMKSAVHTFPVRPQPDTRDRAPARDRSDNTFPHDRSPTPAKAGAERIDPEDPIVRESLSPGQRSNLGVIVAPEIVELPSSAEGRARSSARGAFGKADRIHEIQRGLDAARKNHEDREHVRKQAARFGEKILGSISQSNGRDTRPVSTATPTEIEEW